MSNKDLTLDDVDYIKHVLSEHKVWGEDKDLIYDEIGYMRRL